MIKLMTFKKLALIFAFVLLTHTYAIAGDDLIIPDQLKLAKNGDMHALDNLRHILERDTSFIDFAEPARWYEKAAEQGVAQAQRIVAKRLDAARSSVISNAEIDDARAFELYKKAAEQNDTIACFMLGSAYLRGVTHGCNASQVVEKNPAKAYKWFLKAAKSGHAEAQYNLGNLYAFGQGVATSSHQAEYWWELGQKNFGQVSDQCSSEEYDRILFDHNMDVSDVLRLAKQGDPQMQLRAAKLERWHIETPVQSFSFDHIHEWLELSAARGDVEAMWRLADGYHRLNQYDKTFDWLEKAAAENNPDALLRLGKCYYFGSVIDKDYVQAINYFEKSARLGNPEAQFYLGLINFFGQGTEKDIVTAYMWYSLSAAANGAGEAVLAKNITAEKMNAEQLGKSQNLINNFRNSTQN